MRVLVLAALLVVLSGCGDADTAKRTAPDGVEVVEAWAKAVREGDYASANELFALPAKIANGTEPVTIEDRKGIDAFNRSLPCGAIVTSAQQTANDYLRVTFRLTEGRGCGPGTGDAAEVTFRVVDGRITEWLREAVGPPPGTTEI